MSPIWDEETAFLCCKNCDFTSNKWHVTQILGKFGITRVNEKSHKRFAVQWILRKWHEGI